MKLETAVLSGNMRRGFIKPMVLSCFYFAGKKKPWKKQLKKKGLRKLRKWQPPVTFEKTLCGTSARNTHFASKGSREAPRPPNIPKASLDYASIMRDCLALFLALNNHGLVADYAGCLDSCKAICLIFVLHYAGPARPATPPQIPARDNI